MCECLLGWLRPFTLKGQTDTDIDSYFYHGKNIVENRALWTTKEKEGEGREGREEKEEREKKNVKCRA